MHNLLDFRFFTIIFLFLFGMSSVNGAPDSTYKFLGAHTDDVESVAATPNNTYFASGSWDKSINIFSNDSNFTMFQTLTGHNAAVTSLSFSRDGKALVSGGKDYKVMVWKLDEATKLFTLFKEISMVHTAGINSVIYGPSLKMVYSAGDDGKIMIYDLVKSASKIIDNKIPVRSIGLSSNSRFIFCADESTVVKQYDGLGNLIKSFEGHMDYVNAVEASIDNRFLVSGSNDKTAIIWDVNTGKVKHTLVGHTWKVTTISISPDSKYVTTGSNDGTIMVWNMETGALLKTINIPGATVRSVAFSADEKLIISGIRVPSANDDDEYGAFIWPSGVKREIPTPPGAKPIARPVPVKTTPGATKPATGAVKTPPVAPKSTTSQPNNVTSGKTTQASTASKKIIEKTDEVEISIEEQ